MTAAPADIVVGPPAQHAMTAYERDAILAAAGGTPIRSGRPPRNIVDPATGY